MVPSKLLVRTKFTASLSKELALGKNEDVEFKRSTTKNGFFGTSKKTLDVKSLNLVHSAWFKI